MRERALGTYLFNDNVLGLRRKCHGIFRFGSKNVWREPSNGHRLGSDDEGRKDLDEKAESGDSGTGGSSHFFRYCALVVVDVVFQLQVFAVVVAM